MKLVVLIEARQDVFDAALYLEGQQSGLGDDLFKEFEAALQSLLEYPRAYRVVDFGRVRKKNLARFRYALYYRASREQIVVFAFGHLHRKPGYWRDRL